jgi:thiamine-monophosphate kinase
MRTEFDLIRNIKTKYGLKFIGDDCAVLPKDSKTDLVITADMLVEDVDFRLNWTTPEFLGQKALAVSLSDVAAMGANPKWAMLSIGIPEAVWNGSFIDKFYKGWFTLAKLHKIELVGGDISRTPDRVTIDSIAAGEVPKGKAIMRSDAKPGDSIFVSGSLGGAAGGLTLLESGERHANTRSKKRELIDRQLRPMPRVEIGKVLSRSNVATAMIDISDGLAADLHHLCDASGVGARIEIDTIPLDKNLKVVNGADELHFALSGGEDFELLFTSKRTFFSSPKLSSVTRIGEVTSNAGIVELAGREADQILPRIGYRHF